MMLLVTVTVHRMLPPPPLPESLHWLTEVIALGNDVVTESQTSEVFAAPVQARTVTVELAIRVATVRLLTTVTSQRRPSPPTFAMPLHCSTAGAVTANAGVAAELTPQMTLKASRNAPTSAVRRFRVIRDC
jgi:hypothetical protein